MLPSDLYRERLDAGALKPDPAQDAVLPALDRLAADLARPEPRGLFRRRAEPVRGLYLWGGVGTGKSMLMDLALATLAAPVHREHFHAFMQRVQGGLTRERQAGTADAVAPVADAIAEGIRLLALDEMQVTDIADAMILGRLFERLWERGVALVTTSNRPPEDLYKDGLNRAQVLPFIAALGERCEVVGMGPGADHRQGRTRGRPRYFCPLGPEARAAMDAAWDELAHGQARPVRLRVMGRELEVPLFHNGSARARFHDLCGRPLGPPDFLALAQACRVLLIDEIPRLSAANFNAARRFVLLVDALYEARVTLFASAAATPDRLYVEGEGAFEFARTASRLMEMQGADWPGVDSGGAGVA